MTDTGRRARRLRKAELALEALIGARGNVKQAAADLGVAEGTLLEWAYGRTDETTVETLYRYFDTDGNLLYVGITSVGNTRAYQHARLAEWWPQVVWATFEHHGSRDACLAAEAQAIRVERPRYNVDGTPQKGLVIRFKVKRLDQPRPSYRANRTMRELIRVLHRKGWPEL